MGDGKTYTTTTASLLHTYTVPGTYIIRVIGTDTSNKKAEASTKVYISPGVQDQYQLSIQPSFAFKNGGIEYSFKAVSNGVIDRVVRTFSSPTPTTATLTSKANETVKRTFTTTGTYTVNAKAYR
jgi:hypothetical protein